MAKSHPEGSRVAAAQKVDPKVVTLSREESEALIGRVERGELSEEDRALVAKLIGVFYWLTWTLQETRISMGRLKALLFGRKARGKKPKKDDKPPDDEHGGPAGGSRKKAPAEETSTQPPAGEPDGATKPRGHGRYGAKDYPGARDVRVSHDALHTGQCCPQCERGRLYALDDSVTVRIDGHAPLSATRYERERLRCSACQAVLTAPLPPEAGEERYTARAKVILALSRCHLATPFHRLEHFQSMLGVPVADATQWDQLEHVADAAWPVYNQLVQRAAQASLLYHDDTSARVLSLIRENRCQTPPERTGMFTTAIVACCEGARRIVLYFTGRQHAGENLADVLALRATGLPPPLVMSDALSANQCERLIEHIRCLCLAHGLRDVRELAEHFPDQCQHVLEVLGKVYAHDEHCARHALDPEARLSYHQSHSAPLMNGLHTWLDAQFDAREVEPNSALGKALRYFLNHWEGLTRFLHIAGAPLDSNLVERALKSIIRQRHNSRVFASAHSAYVLSLLTSLWVTCAEAGVNAFDYLVAVLEHRTQVHAEPARWLPWNYTARLQAT